MPKYFMTRRDNFPRYANFPNPVGWISQVSRIDFSRIDKAPLSSWKSLKLEAKIKIIFILKSYGFLLTFFSKQILENEPDQLEESSMKRNV